MTDRESIIKILDDFDPEGGTFPGEDESLETFWGAQADALLEWLAEHDRQVAEAAYDEGVQVGIYYHEDMSYAPLNPYRYIKETNA